MVKRIVSLVVVLLFMFCKETMACDVCEANQPAALKGITHGTGPTGTIDYIIICIAVVIVSVTLFLSIKYLVKPQENDPNHIKNIVVN